MKNQTINKRVYIFLTENNSEGTLYYAIGEDQIEH
jgi:hypothetical protein